MTRPVLFRLSLALGVVLAIVSLGSVLAGPSNPALLALRQLESAAAQGDASAQQILAEYGSYADRRGLSTDAAALAGGSADRQFTAGDLRIGIQGVVPFSLRVDALAELTSRDTIERYVTERKAALAKLASAKQGAPISVSVGFSTRPSLAAFLDLARAHGGVPQQLLVDATVGGQRRFTQVFSAEFTAAMMEQSNDQIIAGLGDAAESMGQPLCGAAPEHVEWVVQSARLNIAADDALALSNRPTVLLVDPVDDVLDGAGMSAVWVTVASWPNVTTALEDVEGRRPADDICQEDK